METNVNYTVVGAFVISLFAAIIIGVIWLSAGLSTQKYQTYKVLMQESVSGLSPDSAVEYNGVSVGNVISMQINKRDPQIVELLLKIGSQAPITEGTTATLKSKGLTGITFIALADKGTDKKPLLVLPGETYPIIRTTPSFYLQLDSAVKQLSLNFRKLSDSIRDLLDAENMKSLKAILHNLQDITGTINANAPQINTILLNASHASKQLSPAIQAFSLQTLPQANEAITNMGNMTQNLNAVSQELKQNPSILIRGKAQRSLGPGEQ